MRTTVDREKPDTCMEPRMTSFDVLRDEHRRIEQMLSVLGVAADRLARGGDVPPFIDEVLDFFSLFADGRHHAKEEEQLFPLLAGHRFELHHGVIDALKNQHELGRTLVRELRLCLARLRGGDPSAATTFAALVSAYTELLRVHIEIEDRDVYREAEKTLGAEAAERLREAFAALDATPAAREDLARWERLAERTRTASAER